MTSNLTLYKDAKIIPDKNFVVDNLSDYLSTLTYIFIEDFQYLRNDLSLVIKISKDQVYSESLKTYNYNYLKVAQNGATYYYFIVKKTQLGSSTIALDLKMDTLNTYQYGTAFTASPRTKVNREHKDRFIPTYSKFYNTTYFNTNFSNIPLETYINGTLYLKDADNLDHTTPATLYLRPADLTPPTRRGIEFSNMDYDSDEYEACKIDSFVADNGEVLFSGVASQNIVMEDMNLVLIRKIDLKSEDINAPLYKLQESELQQQNDIPNVWKLYYRNADEQDNSPVECYLMGDIEVPVLIPEMDAHITTSDVPSGKYLLFWTGYNQARVIIDFDDANGAQRLKTFDYDAISHTDYFCVVVYNDSGTLKVYYNVYRYIGLDQYAKLVSSKEYTPTSDIYFSGADYDLRNTNCRLMDSMSGPWPTSSANYPFYPSRANTILTAEHPTSVTLATAETIDRTLAVNLKIINIPYSPSQFEIMDSQVVMDNNWTYDTTSKFFKLGDFNIPFKNSVITSTESILEGYRVNPGEITSTDDRYLFDSKIFHSDYFYPKFVYDSFTKIFPLEKIDFKDSLPMNQNKFFNFDFVMSRNIVSKFLFKFPFIYGIKGVEDYENILAVERNNEEVLYNSSYLNYVRTGYNYDVKAKKRSENVGGATIALTATGAVLSGIAGVLTGNPIAIGTAITTGIGLVGSLINYGKTTAQNEENIQRKLDEAQRQAVSVLNADDYDLLASYSNNKPKLCYYRVSGQMLGILDDLFYYGGYKSDEIKTPVVNTRYWFNFLSCDLEFTNVTANISEICKQDLIQKFKDGVTFLHKHNSKWDFDQEKENWEVSIIGG